MINHPSNSLYNDQIAQTIPLLLFQYQSKQHAIHPQQLPIMIHNPAQLASKLQGIEPVRLSEALR